MSSNHSGARRAYHDINTCIVTTQSTTASLQDQLRALQNYMSRDHPRPIGALHSLYATPLHRCSTSPNYKVLPHHHLQPLLLSHHLLSDYRNLLFRTATRHPCTNCIWNRPRPPRQLRHLHLHHTSSSSPLQIQNQLRQLQVNTTSWMGGVLCMQSNPQTGTLRVHTSTQRILPK